MNRLKQRVSALEGTHQTLTIGDWQELCEHEDSGHTIDWAMVRKDGAAVSDALSSLKSTPKDDEELRRWSEEHQREMALERKLGLRSPGPVSARLRRYVVTAAQQPVVPIQNS